MSRLRDSVYPLGRYLQVDEGLNWGSGDLLGLPATNIDPHQSQTAQIDSYDPLSGVITLVEPLKTYHFGADESTAE